MIKHFFVFAKPRWLCTYTILPSVQKHNEVFRFGVSEFDTALVAVKIVREFFCVEIHVRHVLSGLRGRVQRVVERRRTDRLDGSHRRPWLRSLFNDQRFNLFQTFHGTKDKK